MSFRFDREAEEKFLNKPVIADVARVITETAKTAFSDRHYAPRGANLRLQWLATEAFRAGAYVSDNGEHEIRLSYGSAIEIYRDAFVLPLICERTLIDQAFDPIYNLLGYGNRRKDVLPVGLSAEDAKISIIRLTSTWLYLHEQAHLLQRHGEIAKAHGATELFSHSGELVDAGDCDLRSLTGRDAALRHAFELSADYEATTNLLMAEGARGLSLAELWCFAAGLMCLVQRFYGDSTESIQDTPSGTHPHPGLRMRMIMKKVEGLFALPEFATRTPWAKGPAHARAVMDHAVYTANVFWHLRYLGLEARTPLLDTVALPKVVPATYQEAIYKVWSEVRSDVVKGHLGFGEPVVLFLGNPKALS